MYRDTIGACEQSVNMRDAVGQMCSLCRRCSCGVACTCMQIKTLGRRLGGSSSSCANAQVVNVHPSRGGRVKLSNWPGSICGKKRVARVHRGLNLVWNVFRIVDKQRRPELRVQRVKCCKSQCQHYTVALATGFHHVMQHNGHGDDDDEERVVEASLLTYIYIYRIDAWRQEGKREGGAGRAMWVGGSSKAWLGQRPASSRTALLACVALVGALCTRVIAILRCARGLGESGLWRETGDWVRERMEDSSKGRYPNIRMRFAWMDRFGSDWEGEGSVFAVWRKAGGI